MLPGANGTLPGPATPWGFPRPLPGSLLLADGITVRELIEALGAFDPDAKVCTIVTCDCCTACAH